MHVPVRPIATRRRGLACRALAGLVALPALAALLAAQPRPAAPPAPTGVSGIVVDSAGTPIAGAFVAVEQFFRADGGTPRRDTISTDAAGRFRLVGLDAGPHALDVQKPGYLVTRFDFEIAAGITADLRITLNAAPPELVQAAPVVASIGDTSAASRAQRGGAVISGKVISESGRPIAGAQVQAMGTNYNATTADDGTFRLGRLTGGPYFMRVRRVGYEPVVFTATLALGDSIYTTVKLPGLGPVGSLLDTVKVRADFDRSSRRLRGFEERRRTARGLFIDKGEIDERKAFVVSDLLRGRANITVMRNPASGDVQVFGPRLSISGGQCQLGLIIDGTLVPNVQGSLDSLVPVDMIQGIEVYNSGTSVPSQFAQLGTDCGAIIIWTR